MLVEPSLLMLHSPWENDLVKSSKGKPVTIKERADTGVFLDLLENKHDYIKLGDNFLFQMQFLNENIQVDG